MEEKIKSGFHAIILAAGRSSRMNRDKAGLPWIGEKPLLLWMVDVLSAAGWQTTVVTNPETFARWDTTLPAGSVVLNSDPSRGKTSSLACGVQNLPPDARWILISAVDQPRLPTLYQRMRHEAEVQSARIIVPVREGRRGHPVVLAEELRNELLALDENSQGLRGLLDAHHPETYRLPDGDPAECQWDLNTPDVYEKALAFFRKHAASE